MSVSSVINKYGDPEGEEFKPKDLFDNISSWKDSKTVTDLSDHLKGNFMGVSLVIIGNSPALHFNPGLKKDNSERWNFAERSLQLLKLAKEDLIIFVKNKVINLPVVSD
jgi:hypothetical protein